MAKLEFALVIRMPARGKVKPTVQQLIGLMPLLGVGLHMSCQWQNMAPSSQQNLVLLIAAVLSPKCSYNGQNSLVCLTLLGLCGPRIVEALVQVRADTQVSWFPLAERSMLRARLASAVLTALPSMDVPLLLTLWVGLASSLHRTLNHNFIINLMIKNIYV